MSATRPPVTGSSTIQRSRSLGNRAWEPAVAGAVVMTALGAWHLGRPALWADELATDGAARLSWGRLWELLSHVDLVLSAYYVFMHLWVNVVGHSAVAERAPSLLAITLAAGLTTDIARRLWGRTAAWITVALFLANPATSRFAAEARPYAASVAAVTVAAWLLVGSPPKCSPVRDAASALAVLVAGLMQPVSLLSVFALLLLRSERGRGVVRWCSFVALACLPAVVLFLVGWTSQSSVWNWIVVQPWTNAPMRMGSVFLAPELGGAMLLLAAAAVRRRGPELALAAWGLLPVLVLFGAGMVFPIYTGRLLEFTVPGTVLLASRTLSSMPRIGVVCSLLGAVLLGAPTQEAIRTGAGHGQDSRAVASILGRQERAGDVVIYGDHPTSISWSPRDAVRYYVPASHTPRDALALAPQRTDGRFLARLCSETSRCLGTPSRIWIVRADSPSDPRTGLPFDESAYLTAHTRVVRVWHRPEMTVALLTR